MSFRARIAALAVAVALAGGGLGACGSDDEPQAERDDPQTDEAETSPATTGGY